MEEVIINNLKVHINRKKIKNIYITILPPEGKVRVSCPIKTKSDVIRMLIISRSKWIKKQQEKFKNQLRIIPREFVSGESHYFEGMRYILDVIETTKKPHITIKNKKYIEMYVREGSTLEYRSTLMDEWYRENLKESVGELISKWEEIIGVTVNGFNVRKMKTRWGSCNTVKKHILINLELVKKTKECLEYVVLHEMIHLLEKSHNANFKNLMTTYMPNWKSTKDKLNEIIHE